MTAAAIAVLLLTASSLATSQTSTDAQKHFRWSERTAHELDYKDTIKTTNDLTPKDRTALRDAVFAQLKRAASKDEQMFEGISERQLQKMAADTRIELVDLSGDAKPEVIAQANSLGPCGGTGNCIVWVFQMTPDGVKLLLDSTIGKWGGYFEVLTIRPWTTNGFRDIVLGSHGGVSDRTLVLYKYSGGRYRQSACYDATWMSATTFEGLRSPEISPCEDSTAPDTQR
jgi:hypothetical protein